MIKQISNRQRHNQFSRGRGVFACETCGRQTRGTSECLDAKCCAECYELAGMENMFIDNGPEEFAKWSGGAGEVENLLAKIESAGGSRAKVIDNDWTGLFAWVVEQNPQRAGVGEAGSRVQASERSQNAVAQGQPASPAIIKGGTLLNLCYNAKGDVTLYVNGKKAFRGTEQEAKNTGNGYGDGRWGVVYDRRK